MFFLFELVSHAQPRQAWCLTITQRAEDYIRVMLDKTNVAETLKYIEELALAELQATAAQTYVTVREGNVTSFGTCSLLVSWYLSPPSYRVYL